MNWNWIFRAVWMLCSGVNDMSREMKDSGVEWIGEIPENWKVERLQRHLREINRINNPIETNCILSLNNKTGVIPYEQRDNMGNKKKEDYSQYRIAYPDTLVMNSMNVIIGSVGISHYYGCVSPVYYVLKPIYNTELRYVNYIFQIERFQKELRKYANGIMEIRLRISVHDTLRRLVPMPDIKEQCRIANFLDNKCKNIDTVIEKTKMSIEKYKKLKETIVVQTVTRGVEKKRKMKNTKIEWLEKIPFEWEECRIKNVIFPVIKDVYDEDEIVTCFRDGTVTLRKNRREDGFTISFTEKGDHGVDKGDLVIHGMDAFAGAIGCSDSRGKITPVVHVCKTTGNNRYFMYFLRSMAYGNILMDLSNGVRIRSSDYRNFAKLGIFRICVPPLEEQNLIVEFLDRKVNEIEKIVEKKQIFCQELEAYKKSLIYEYVTGKKEVPES